MPRMLRRSVAGFCALALLAEAARGDVFALRSGGRIVGELVEEPKTAAAEPTGRAEGRVRIKTSVGAVVVLAREDVVDHVRLRPALEEYETVRPNFPDSAHGQWELAEWCRAQGLVTLRKTHLTRVVELDPDHEAARRGLGQVRLNGEWIHPRAFMTALGYVDYHGRWRLPQEVAVLEERRKKLYAERAWFHDLAVWRDWIAKGDARAPAVRARLLQLRDPAALRAIHFQMRRETLAPIRLLYCEALGNIATPGAHGLLMERALVDAHREVRTTSADRLALAKSADAVLYFLRMLKSDDNKIVNRAASALRQMKDPAAVPLLIDAVTTWHKAPAGAAINSGGLRFQTISSSEKIPYLNQDVVEALCGLTEQNLGSDVDAWRAWYAAKVKAETSEAALRRD